MTEFHHILSENQIQLQYLCDIVRDLLMGTSSLFAAQGNFTPPIVMAVRSLAFESSTYKFGGTIIIIILKLYDMPFRIRVCGGGGGGVGVTSVIN